MNSKERILNILDRKPVDRLPVDIWHTSEVYADLAKHFNVDNEIDLYEKMGVDKWYWIAPAYEGSLAEKIDGADSVTPWGIQMRTVQSGLSLYGERVSSTFESYTLENIDEYPYWPDPDKFNYKIAAATTENVSRKFATLGPWVSFYEIYCGMRGLEKAMMDLALEPDFVNAALDRIEHAQTEMMKKLFPQEENTEPREARAKHSAFELPEPEAVLVPSKTPLAEDSSDAEICHYRAYQRMPYEED